MPIAWIAGLLPLAQVHHSHAFMFSYSTFLDVPALLIGVLFITGLVLFIVGLVKHRKWMWITGLVMMAFLLLAVGFAIMSGIADWLAGIDTFTVKRPSEIQD